MTNEFVMPAKTQQRKWRSWLEHWLNRGQRGAEELLAWAVAKGLLPGIPVRLISDAGEQCLQLPGGLTVTVVGAMPSYLAVLLPEALLLRRRVDLPLHGDEAFRQAIQLEVEAATPFPFQQTVWGWRRRAPRQPGQQAAEIVLSSCPLVEQHLAALAPRYPLLASAAPEVWADAEMEPVVLQGFGEVRRQVAYRQRLRRIAVLALSLVVLGGVLVLVPLLHQRQQAIAAGQHLAALSREAAPVRAMQAQLGQALQLHRELASLIAAEPDLVALLDVISVVIPDGAWLSSFVYDEKGGLQLSGVADNGAALIQAFQQRPEFRNVRAPAAIAREAQSGKERFTLEMEVVAQ